MFVSYFPILLANFPYGPFSAISSLKETFFAASYPDLSTLRLVLSVSSEGFCIGASLSPRLFTLDTRLPVSGLLAASFLAVGPLAVTLSAGYFPWRNAANPVALLPPLLPPLLPTTEEERPSPMGGRVSLLFPKVIFFLEDEGVLVTFPLGIILTRWYNIL